MLKQGIFPIPFVNSDHVLDQDMQIILSKYEQNNNGFGLLAMTDEADPQAGLFLHICEDEPPPNWGFSLLFEALWKWAQKQGYTWIRLDENGYTFDDLKRRPKA